MKGTESDFACYISQVRNQYSDWRYYLCRLLLLIVSPKCCWAIYKLRLHDEPMLIA